ncbi:hypothetical protein CHS0354_036831 [Potamilus streckersoni]|uniref:Uncharacterized protein n=1 Tax=Potamilus streckersoni TaxID=2493646 RepID=A0AAE0VND6_9BIVA|nr:hypothetical protein CHS0354_036831 [Potamilus streckersoni]
MYISNNNEHLFIDSISLILSRRRKATTGRRRHQYSNIQGTSTMTKHRDLFGISSKKCIQSVVETDDDDLSMRSQDVSSQHRFHSNCITSTMNVNKFGKWTVSICNLRE